MLAMDITRGSLAEISRPASNHRSHLRPGSRVSLGTPSSAGSTRQGVDTSNSLEILPPESPVVNQQEFDLEVVELFSSDSDSECNVGSQSDDGKDGGAQQPNSNGHNNNDRSKEGHQRSSNSGADKSPTGPDPLDSIPDPKIREAMRKMQQLDRILAKKVLKEKEVKRQRLQAHRDMERELQGLKPEGRDEQREVSDNTSRFLALVPPASHSEGISLDQEPVDPVFQTQPAEGDTPIAGDKANGAQRNKDSKLQAGNSTDRSSQVAGEGKTKRGGRQRSKAKGPDDTLPGGGNDFIQRNIDLASDAGNVIAMTDDEKKRLEELLQDVEMLVDEEEKADSTHGMNALQLSAGVGYIPDADEQQALLDIDAKLKALLPAEDFEHISTTPSQGRGSYYRDEPGEKILKDTKDERTQQERLKRIEVELEYLENRVEREIYKSPRLSQENLSELLEQCSELSSRAATETDSILQASPRSGHVYSSADEDSYKAQEATPRLPEDVLQKLLADARESCLSESRLSLLTPVSSLDTEQMLTSRSEGSDSQSFAVVSQSTIKELLRNPRATSTVASTTGMIMDIARRVQDGPAEDDFRTLRDATSGQGSVRGGTVNGHSGPQDSAQDLSPTVFSRTSTQHNTAANQNLSLDGQDTPPSPRHSQQSPQPHRSNTGSNQGAESAVKTSLSLRSFSNSTDFPAVSASLKSPEPPPSRIRSRNGAPSRPRTSTGSPKPSTSAKDTFSSSVGHKPQLSVASEALDSLPQPPLSRQIARSSRTKAAKPLAGSSLDSRGTPDSLAGHTDSRASTNTLVSSSDFEYEDNEEIAQQLLSHSPGSGNTGQRSKEDSPGLGSSLVSRTIEQSVARSIARFEKKGTEEERFSPPLV
ncbi:uncharacterized protein LOC110988502 isoform X2 [Acanthaster planci]|uniref:Fibrous sheath-interacting protein 1 n=1 Tax=Acanthaster planci TaxID=133434 RepID=A0A8B7ZSB7_ACAPL|nr:uncharacterized protein LOC110988502 isoform X2 [Acanthaster planci]